MVDNFTDCNCWLVTNNAKQLTDLFPDLFRKCCDLSHNSPALSGDGDAAPDLALKISMSAVGHLADQSL